MENTNTDISFKPVIGITLGDFNGIGPEVIIKSLLDNRINRLCTPVIYGSTRIISRYKKLLNVEGFNYQQINNIEGVNERKVNVINCWEDNLEVEPGKVTQEAGRCAYLSLARSTEDLRTQTLHAVVTAPINKHNIQSVDFQYPGHTEYYTSSFGASESLMLLVGGHLRVGTVTGHIPVNRVSDELTQEKIIKKLTVLIRSLQEDFSIVKPRVAVLGLNPHAGEGGLLGSEEQNVIIPAIEHLKNQGNLVFGPFPADGFFGTMQQNNYDAVLSMYHDQGLIPFKMMAFEEGVNFTAGLPVIRTSPDHGTAYDIAGTNIASENSMRAALFLACDIARNRFYDRMAREKKF